MSACCGIDQLRRDPDLIVCLADAAFQHVAHTHLPTRILHLHRLALVGKRGVASDDKEAGDLGEVSGNVLGDAVAEILLLGIVAHVDEGQHDDGGFVGQGKRRRLRLLSDE